MNIWNLVLINFYSFEILVSHDEMSDRAYC